jgi:hypothetical protein
LACVVAAAMDTARCHRRCAAAAQSQAFVDLMIPVVKGWSTESAIDIASLGVQVHGGMGFIEETGAAQHLRDARITTIYEGTTGIQAADLIGRKIARDGGRRDRRGDRADARGAGASCHARTMSGSRRSKCPCTTASTRSNRRCASSSDSYGSDAKKPSVGAVPFLELLGIVRRRWQNGARRAISHQRLSEAKPATPTSITRSSRLPALRRARARPCAGLAYTAVHGAAVRCDRGRAVLKQPGFQNGRGHRMRFPLPRGDLRAAAVGPRWAGDLYVLRVASPPRARDLRSASRPRRQPESRSPDFQGLLHDSPVARRLLAACGRGQPELRVAQRLARERTRISASVRCCTLAQDRLKRNEVSK